VREPPFARLVATREAWRANHIAPDEEAGAPASASAAGAVDEVSPPDEVDEADEVVLDDDDDEAESPPPQAMAIAPTRAVIERRTRTRFIVSSSKSGATACHGETRAKRRTGETGTVSTNTMSSFEINKQTSHCHRIFRCCCKGRVARTKLLCSSPFVAQRRDEELVRE
jgi:hypothetical protein